MAVVPVFVEDNDALKSKLRLSGSATGTDSEEVMDEAILQVRADIFDALGSSLVASINATTYSETGTTPDEIRRLKAASVEVFGVKARMLRDAPTFFMDAANGSEQAFNDDGLLRDADTDDTQLIQYYEAKFLHGLDELKEITDSGPNMTVRTFSPDSPKVIGQSITSGRGLGGLYD